VTAVGYIDHIRGSTKEQEQGTNTCKEANIMKRINYMKRATTRFLEGTKYRSPVEAVEAGVRSLTDWAEMLAEEREFETEANRDAGKRARTGLLAAS
jgi:hypothetical protein